MNSFIVDCRNLKNKHRKYGFHDTQNEFYRKRTYYKKQNFNQEIPKNENIDNYNKQNEFYRKKINDEKQNINQEISKNETSEKYDILTGKKSPDQNKINNCEEFIKNVKLIYLHNGSFRFISSQYKFFEQNDVLFSYNGYDIAYTDCEYNYKTKKNNIRRQNIVSKLNYQKKLLTCLNIENFKNYNMLSFRSGDTLTITINHINQTSIEQGILNEKYDELYSRNIQVPLHFLHNKLKPCFVCNKMCNNREIVFDCECGIHYNCSNGVNHCHDCVKQNI